MTCNVWLGPDLQPAPLVCHSLGRAQGKEEQVRESQGTPRGTGQIQRHGKDTRERTLCTPAWHTCAPGCVCQRLFPAPSADLPHRCPAPRCCSSGLLGTAPHLQDQTSFIVALPAVGLASLRGRSPLHQLRETEAGLGRGSRSIRLTRVKSEAGGE